jgi:hypothetical protein
MSKGSWVELCVSDPEQSIQWFESTLGFRVAVGDADEYSESAAADLASLSPITSGWIRCCTRIKSRPPNWPVTWSFMPPAVDNSDCSPTRLTALSTLLVLERHRADESDGPPWNSRAGSSHVGHGAAVPTAAGQFGMVASVLSRMSHPYASLRVTLVQPAAARGQMSGTTLPTAYSSHGSLQNPSTMDGARCSLAPCQRFPLERHRSQMRLACHVAKKLVNMPSEEVGWGFTPG